MRCLRSLVAAIRQGHNRYQIQYLVELVSRKRGHIVFKANCADCGEVVIRADESSLHVAGPQTSWRCTFHCPVCRRETVWPVPEGAGHLLVARGARVTIEPVPSAQCEPPLPTAARTPQTDRTLQLDDLIDFHALLSGDDWFDQLLQIVHSPTRA
jgi:hypothetical protein